MADSVILETVSEVAAGFTTMSSRHRRRLTEAYKAAIRRYAVRLQAYQMRNGYMAV